MLIRFFYCFFQRQQTEAFDRNYLLLQKRERTNKKKPVWQQTYQSKSILLILSSSSSLNFLCMAQKWHFKTSRNYWLLLWLVFATILKWFRWAHIIIYFRSIDRIKSNTPQNNHIACKSKYFCDSIITMAIGCNRNELKRNALVAFGFHLKYGLIFWSVGRCWLIINIAHDD